jgi:hypothetical protein
VAKRFVSALFACNVGPGRATRGCFRSPLAADDLSTEAVAVLAATVAELALMPHLLPRQFIPARRDSLRHVP